MSIRPADLTAGCAALLLLSTFGSCGGGGGGEGPTTVTTTTTTRPPTPPLRADCGGPYQAVAGSPITFNGSASTSPTGRIATYNWEFGDGATGAGVTPTHTYRKRSDPPSTRDYTVRLTITDSASQTASCTVNCKVTGIY